MRTSIGVRSFALAFVVLALMNVPAHSQWAPGNTVYWYVDGSVNNLNWDPGSVNVQQEIESIMSSIADDWIVATGIDLTVAQGYGPMRIKIMAGSLQGNPEEAIANTDPNPRFCTDNLEAVITLNWSSQLIYKDAVDPVFMRDLSQESAPYTIDIRSILLHELAHAFGMEGEGTVGVLLGYYHGSDREIDGEEAMHIRNVYSYCSTLTSRSWQRVRTSFDDGNPFHASSNGTVWSNMWSPRVTPGSMMQRSSGWTVSWGSPYNPTVHADAYQQIGSTNKKFQWWQYRHDVATYAATYDLDVALSDDTKTALAWYYDAYPYTLTEGEYCDGSTAPCVYQVKSTHVSTPYSSDVAPDFESAPDAEVEPANSGDVFLYWRDNNGGRHYNSLIFVDVEEYSTLTPVFQKHLGTDHTVSDQLSESGTSTNNQRKIAFVDSSPGMHHQVYESCGDIFYCNSTNQGQSWSGEVLLSNVASSDVEKPSIYADADSVWVAWSEGSELRLIKFPPSDPTSIMPYVVSSLQAPCDGFTPVLVRMSYTGASIVVVVYESVDGIRWGLFVDGVYHSQGFVFATIPIPNYVQVSPSIVTYGENQFEVVWRDGPEVWYRPGSITSGPNGYALDWLSDEELVPLGNRSAVGAPTISYSNAASPATVYTAIACETGDAAPYGIGLTFRKAGLPWWHVQTFIIANEVGRLWAPSISMLDEQAIWTGFEHFRLAYNYTDDFVSGIPTTRQVWAMKPLFDSNGQLIDYPVEIQGADALHPSVVTRPPTGGNLSVFTGLTGSTMNAIENQYNGLNKTRSMNWHRSRELSLRSDTTVVTFGLANIRSVNGTSEIPVDWYRPVDSSVVGIDITVEDDFRTGTFPVNSGTRLKYTVMDTKRGLNQLPPLMHLGLEVRDAGSDALLGTLATLIPNSIQNGKRVADMNINMTGYSGHTVYVRVTLTGHDSTISLHAQDIWSVHALNSANFPKDWDVRGDLSDTSPSAEDITLDQNFPNPFNPATTIVYAIPEKLMVTLTVYDIIGRVVETLVDREMPAGPHSMTFDATNLPSGLYLYRLTAGGGTLSRSMTVVK